jgi:hypothetical protein
VTRKLTALAATLLVLVPGAAGCGGDDESSPTKGDLGARINLKVAQDEADIQEFCNLAPSPEGSLYERALVTVVAATDDLASIYKEHPDGTYYDALKKREVELRQRVSELAKKLRTCGGQGRAQAAKLTQALQQS